MKTNIIKLEFLQLSLIFTTAMCLFFYSCQEDEIMPVDEPFDYEQIGIEHNKGLDYIFEYLKKQGVGVKTELKSAINLFDLTKQATLSFAKTSKITKGVNYDKLPLVYQSFDRNTLKSAGIDELSRSIQSEVELTPLQISILDELDQTMSNLKIGLEPTIEKIKSIESNIKAQCTQEEAELLLSCTSVARHSLEYWTSNFEKWINELGGTTEIANNVQRLKSANVEDDWDWFWGTLENMGKSDVVGAGIGAGVGALAGGVGAAPGAVAGGCYSSAGRGIVSLLDHWGIW